MPAPARLGDWLLEACGGAAGAGCRRGARGPPDWASFLQAPPRPANRAPPLEPTYPVYTDHPDGPIDAYGVGPPPNPPKSGDPGRAPPKPGPRPPPAVRIADRRKQAYPWMKDDAYRERQLQQGVLSRREEEQLEEPVQYYSLANVEINPLGWTQLPPNVPQDEAMAGTALPVAPSGPEGPCLKHRSLWREVYKLAPENYCVNRGRRPPPRKIYRDPWPRQQDSMRAAKTILHGRPGYNFLEVG